VPKGTWAAWRVGHGHLDRSRGPAFGGLQLRHEGGELLAHTVGQDSGKLGALVGDGHVQQDRLRHHARRDLRAEAGGGHVDAFAVDHPLGHRLTVDEVGIGGDALLGEQAAGVLVAALALRRRDEQLRGGHVLRRRPERQERRNGDGHQHHDADEAPAAPQDSEVVMKFHAGASDLWV
jgi:hypothetical protein